MTRTTVKDVEYELEHLNTNALLCGLMQPGERIYYNAGNKQGGFAPVLSIIQREPWAERNAFWLPRFKASDSVRTQYAAVTAANLALRAAWDTIEALKKQSAES